MVTPNRPEATCLIFDRRVSPPGRGTYRAGSSPPSPELLRPPRRFMAMAIVSWVSLLIDPYDMAAVTKRGVIFSTPSTSAIGIGAPVRYRNRERTVAGCREWSV